MKKTAITIGLAIVFFVAFIQISYAEMAKEGNFSGTVFYAGKHNIIPLDKEHFVLTYENFGVRVSDSKDGPFHGMSTHGMGVFYYENGVGRSRGYLFSTDKDGDKIIMEISEEPAQLAPKPTSAIAKIIGGTGKFKGIQGNLEYTRWNLRPAKDGTHQAISKGNGTYKIVEP